VRRHAGASRICRAMTDALDLWGCAAGLAGLCAMFSFMQLRRGETGWIALAAFVFFLWRVGHSLQWWTIAAFFAAGFLAGAGNAVLLRRRGREFGTRLASAVRTLAIVSGVAVVALLAAAR
jgi:hypothetical protein